MSLSGLPFGVPGQMLSGKLYKNINWFYRGLLFGMTDRAGWRNNDVTMLKALWALWDDFGIVHSEMTGFWSGDAAVVRVDAPHGAAGDSVRATAFTRPGRGTLVVVASWATEQRQVSLAVDWLLLGVGKQQAALDVPSIPSLQTEGSAPRPVVDAHGKITLTLAMCICVCVSGPGPPPARPPDL